MLSSAINWHYPHGLGHNEAIPKCGAEAVRDQAREQSPSRHLEALSQDNSRRMETTMDAANEGGAGKCPVPHGSAGRSNRDWWPNQLDLSVLHQHTALSN